MCRFIKTPPGTTKTRNSNKSNTAQHGKCRRPQSSRDGYPSSIPRMHWLPAFSDPRRVQPGWESAHGRRAEALLGLGFEVARLALPKEVKTSRYSYKLQRSLKAEPGMLLEVCYDSRLSRPQAPSYSGFDRSNAEKTSKSGDTSSSNSKGAAEEPQQSHRQAVGSCKQGTIKLQKYAQAN